MRALLALVGLASFGFTGCGECNTACRSSGNVAATLRAGTKDTDALATVCKLAACGSCFLQADADRTSTCAIDAATFTTRIDAASGLPQTPIQLTGTILIDATSAHDGDAWSFTLASSTGASLVSRSANVTYTHTQLCGSNCVSFSL